MECPKCKSSKLHRIRRNGILRRLFFPLFGYFPWRCFSCNRERMLKIRHEQKTTGNSSRRGKADPSRAASSMRENAAD